jgi:hypothetical protein
MDKYCKNCKHLVGYGTICSSPKNGNIDLVTGEAPLVWAAESRKTDGYCGQEGRFFEEKVIESVKPRVIGNLFKWRY